MAICKMPFFKQMGVELRPLRHRCACLTTAPQPVITSFVVSGSSRLPSSPRWHTGATPRTFQTRPGFQMTSQQPNWKRRFHPGRQLSGFNILLDPLIWQSRCFFNCVDVWPLPLSNAMKFFTNQCFQVYKYGSSFKSLLAAGVVKFNTLMLIR